jgi:formylglycine-generating enzyme required for sulfatase activity
VGLAFFLVLLKCNTLEGQEKKGSLRPTLLRIKVEGGSFEMGKEIHENETPTHEVQLAPFEMDIYEVSHAQFSYFIDDGGYQNKAFWSPEGWSLLQEKAWTSPRFWNHPDFQKPELPVVGISWYEAEAYCKWLEMGVVFQVRRNGNM